MQSIKPCRWHALPFLHDTGSPKPVSFGGFHSDSQSSEAYHLPLMDLQQCQCNHSPTQSYLKEQVPETIPPELWASSFLSQPRTKGPGPSHMNLHPWVQGCDRLQWQCYCTIIKASKGVGCTIPLLSSIRNPVYFLSESVAPTLCEFLQNPVMQALLSHAKQVICQTQLCLQLG